MNPQRHLHSPTRLTSSPQEQTSAGLTASLCHCHLSQSSQGKARIAKMAFHKSLFVSIRIVLFHSRKHISSIFVYLPSGILRPPHASAEFRSSFHFANHLCEVVADFYGVGVE